MYIELTEYDNTKDVTIGPIIINTDNILFIDTINDEQEVYRVMLNVESNRFCIHRQDYDRLKEILIKQNNNCL